MCQAEFFFFFTVSPGTIFLQETHILLPYTEKFWHRFNLAQGENYIFAADLIWCGFNLAQPENNYIWRIFNFAILGKLRQLRQIFSAPKFVRIR